MRGSRSICGRRRGRWRWSGEALWWVVVAALWQTCWCVVIDAGRYGERREVEMGVLGVYRYLQERLINRPPATARADSMAR